MVQEEQLPQVFEWYRFYTDRSSVENFPKIHDVREEIQNIRKSIQCEPEEIEGRIIFITLYAGLRLDGIPALDLWDLIVAFLGNTNQSRKERRDPLMNKREVLPTPHTIHKRKQCQGVINDLDNVDFIPSTDRTVKPVNGEDKHHKSHNKIEAMKDIDSVPSNVQSANHEALLYVFEDNEAVIEMIMKGRSPTMRHVSRTHRVALDWLFDRINLDSKIQIKYIDTKNQLADILTKGNFTRDEWNHLLNLFNISHFSSTSCIAAMAKRAQQDSGEGRVTAKSRPMMNLIARTPSFVSSSASANPGRSSYGYQDPEQPVLDDKAEKPVETSRSNYSQDYGSS